MYYIKFIMKNNIFKLIEYSYYLSLLVLIILYLFPGSLIGYLIYGDLGTQPKFINNPIGTSINHFFYFLFLSTLSLIDRLQNQKLINSFRFLFFISILSELLHYFIPNRAFEFYDLLANCTGVMVVFILYNLLIEKK
jgi:VanZ family protein